MTEYARPARQPVRIIRVIARLNIGGPSIQAITLTARLSRLGYETTLVRGRESPDEGSMDYLAERSGVAPRLVPALRRDPGWHDLAALATLVGILRRERPHIVHTHAAKAGTIGRLAAVIAFPRRRRRPVLIHTYHGHSLSGYFSPAVSRLYRTIERVLAFASDRLIAVSDEVRDELVEMGVAPASRFTVVPLGFDLSRFAAEPASRATSRAAVREELRIPPDARVLTIIARLAPIKRVDRFLQVALALRSVPDAYFVVVGDGELRGELQSSPEAAALGERLIWTGFRRDVAELCFASDLIMQTSDNEGTPVSLIEAQAAGVPVISTDVGGTKSVVGDARLLTRADDVATLARTAEALLTDERFAAEVAVAGQCRVQSMFTLARLVADLDRLYRETAR